MKALARMIHVHSITTTTESPVNSIRHFRQLIFAAYAIKALCCTIVIATPVLGQQKSEVQVAGGQGLDPVPSDRVAEVLGKRAAVTLTPGTLRNSVINNYIGLNRLGFYLRNSGPAVVNIGRYNTIRGNWSRPH